MHLVVEITCALKLLICCNCPGHNKGNWAMVPSLSSNKSLSCLAGCLVLKDKKKKEIILTKFPILFAAKNLRIYRILGFLVPWVSYKYPCSYSFIQLLNYFKTINFKSSVADLDPHRSRTFSWIQIYIIVLDPDPAKNARADK